MSLANTCLAVLQNLDTIDLPRDMIRCLQSHPRNRRLAGRNHVSYDSASCESYSWFNGLPR